ncbi:MULTISPECIES: hypothetical protein [unclassified Providencia]|uniref:hypothetical protein n=1 Tax=unclassified Providencia TaxID=2633465 RepID=UPI00234956B3|nr:MULTISPECIES: hypothetical protein [unclassified Providencia]
MKHYLLFIGLLLSPLSYAATAEDNEMALKVMTISRFSGICSSTFNLAGFQADGDSKKIDMFVAEFIANEASKMGMTVEEFVSNCKDAINTYDEYKAEFKRKSKK